MIELLGLCLYIDCWLVWVAVRGGPVCLVVLLCFGCDCWFAPVVLFCWVLGLDAILALWFSLVDWIGVVTCGFWWVMWIGIWDFSFLIVGVLWLRFAGFGCDGVFGFVDLDGCGGGSFVSGYVLV